jgi:DNA-binding MurR/RpiR family transcriptional regulator
MKNRKPEPNPNTPANGVPHRCLIKLKGLYHSLRSAERKAANYLLSASGSISDSGVVEFAQKAGCSEATVVRLAQRLGYEGFPELKTDFAQYEGPVAYRGISSSDEPEVVARKVFETRPRLSMIPLRPSTLHNTGRRWNCC